MTQPSAPTKKYDIDLPAYSDDAGHLFRREAGHPFRIHSGHDSGVKPVISS